MSNLFERLEKSGALKNTSNLSDSKLFGKTEMAPTNIPIIDIALSGSLKGGLASGLTFIAGESKSFKTLLGLIMVKAYLEKHPDAVCLFYDTEFGSTPDYVNSLGLDTARIRHIPVMHVEEMKFKMVKALEAIKRTDKVIILIDSIGNEASKKELEDAISEKSVADMTRAKDRD